MRARTRFLLLGALAVGVLDIAEVILFYFFRGVAPTRVLQGVAAGLLGRASFEGGMRTALLGLALHFFIAFVVVLVGSSRGEGHHSSSRYAALKMSEAMNAFG